MGLTEDLLTFPIGSVIFVCSCISKADCSNVRNNYRLNVFARLRVPCTPQKRSKELPPPSLFPFSYVNSAGKSTINYFFRRLSIGDMAIHSVLMWSAYSLGRYAYFMYTYWAQLIKASSVFSIMCVVTQKQ